ncbi:polyphenol oxidase family protein [Schaalia sp. Marseille-Q2122]|uniref:polyphenol oxidase family protein n=1 Tax=Schaalia sp. Marseille-Q2122 TaxID=2736604 RepID=UPI001589182B|nr:laccase domain-containing protein [Schaalia sp. Marseille-Q2122]
MIEQLSVGGASLYLTQVERGTSPLRDNYGLHVGDDAALVLQRRAALAQGVGRPLLWMDQTHSARVALVRRSEGGFEGDGGGEVTIDAETLRLSASAVQEWPALPCDGVVVDARRWREAPAIAVMTADCMPILFSADEGRVVAAVHAGRIGFEAGILLRALEIFQALGVAVDEISIYIAPAICGHCYEVPAQMRESAAKAHPYIAGNTRWGTPSLDLPRAAAAQLAQAGCAQVSIDGRCTLEEVQWHSHRRDPRSGRQAAIIVPT